MKNKQELQENLRDFLCLSFGKLDFSFTRPLECKQLGELFSCNSLQTYNNETVVLQHAIDWARNRSSQPMSVGDRVCLKKLTYLTEWQGEDLECVVKSIDNVKKRVVIERFDRGFQEDCLEIDISDVYDAGESGLIHLLKWVRFGYIRIEDLQVCSFFPFPHLQIVTLKKP